MPMLDRTIPFTLEIPMVGGLNEDKDATTIGDTEFQKCQKVFLDKGVAEKFPEFTKLNPSDQLEGGADVDGTFRCYADDGTARLLAVCNGKVYEAGDWTTPIYTSLTAGKPCKFIPYRGKVIITNGYDYPVVYDPKTNILGGSTFIESPQQIGKIVYMEADETGWSGGAVDTESHVDTEWTGDSLQGRKLTAAASATETMETTVALDLTEHGDGSTATGWDHIDFSVYHRVLANITSVTIYLETSTGKYYSFTVLAADLDPDEQRNYQWTHLKINRDRFAVTSTPDWADITKIKIGVTASASGEADPTFDNVRLRRSTPIAGDMRKPVATFEPSEETWVGGVADTADFKKDEYGGGVARKLTNGDATAYCDKVIDLTKFADGTDLVDADEMSIWVFINDSSKITDITLKCGDSDLSNRQTYVFDTFLLGEDLWNELKIPLADFTETGTHDWADTVRIQIEGTIAAGGEVSFDHWVVKFKDSESQICDLEKGTAAETWSGTNAAWSQKYVGKGHWSVEALIRPRVAAYFDVTFDAAKDMSVWDDGTDSGSDDDISFWTQLGPDVNTAFLSYLTLTIDVNNGDFATDYYQKTWSSLDWPRWAPGQEKTFKVKKADFTRVGTTGGKDWSTVKAVRWSLTAHPHGEGERKLYVDDLKMSRKSTFKGQFEWKVVYLYGETRSPASAASNLAEITREKALLTNIPTSNDSRVKERELYRRELGEEDFRFSTKIPNNTSTEWVDDIHELGLSMSEMGVPEGNILPPKGVTGLEFKERILLFQDLDNLNSIAYTDPYLIYSWLSARVMPSEVVSGEIYFDNLFLFLRDGSVYRSSEDIDVAQFQPLGNMLKCVSPWGMAKVGGQGMGVVTEDDIKIFGGYESSSIGKPLSPYLKQADYKTEESVLFYHKDHLYYRVETRAGGSYKQFDCYIPGTKWEESNEEAFKSFCSYTGRGDENEMVCGGYDGYVYKLDITYDDSLLIRTKDYSEVDTQLGRGFAFHDKEIQEIRVIAKSTDLLSGPLTMTIFVNGASVGDTVAIPTSGDLTTKYHCYIVQLTGVQNAFIGQQIGLQFQHGTIVLGNKDKNIKIKSVMISGEVKPLEQQYTV